jgi:hypothetical protein
MHHLYKSEEDFNHIQFYLEIELDELMFYLAEINKFIEARVRQANSKDYDDLNCEEKLNFAYHYQNQPRIILCESIIISLATILERFIDVFCEACMVNRSLDLGYNSLKGDMLSRFNIYMKKVVNLDIPFCSDKWADVKAVYEIRNALVHRAGHITEEKKRKIEGFVKQNNGFTINEGNSIEVNEEACKTAASVIKDFFSLITGLAKTELFKSGS